MRNRILFSILNWVFVVILIVFLFNTTAERPDGHGGTIYLPFIVGFFRPYNSGLFPLFIGGTISIIAISFLVFEVMFQIKGKMQIGILVTNLLLAIVFFYHSYSNIFHLIPAIGGIVLFFLHWTDFIVRRKEKLSAN